VSLPAIEVDVVDTTGCGDGFTAGMLAGLLLAAGPVDAVRWSRPAWGRTLGSRALARCWISWAGRNRPWPAGSPPPRPGR
jgi:sugar/nucleoside kinase (ribokinase family)